MVTFVNKYWRGLLAGFVATVVLSAIMIVKDMTGMMPELNVIHALSSMLGAPETPMVGWIAHFIIGTAVWGLLFAAVAGRLTSSYWMRGVIFATGAWLLMMFFFMPMAEAGFFGRKLGVMGPIATLVMHWIYGAVLGSTYGVEAKYARVQQQESNNTYVHQR